MILEISQSQKQLIYHHAAQIYPEECCGLLLGKIVAQVKNVVEVWPTENAWKSESETYWPEQKDLTEKRRYAIAPEAMLKAMKTGRDRNLSVIGIYHSHPDVPAIPSEVDRVCAWPEYSYLIVSVNHGQSQDLRNWVLGEDGYFQPEEIIYLEPS